ncbi:MAG TPA: hypothetical protein VHC20_07385 [Candidatus Paceibacterota bacterium]|nr:hypothetical protein [Candidatus Paceibacterota bacterium]
MISFARRHYKKIQEIGTGIFLWESFNFLYDFIFYPFALAYWGFFVGGIIAAGLTFPINAFVFWLYEYLRVDWLGAHALRELEDEENKSNIAKLATWIGKKKTTWWEKLTSPIVFVTLLFPLDPVIVAIHYRRQHFTGLTVRDWGIFLAATAVANAWWLLKVGIVVEFLEYLWRIISPPFGIAF